MSRLAAFGQWCLSHWRFLLMGLAVFAAFLGGYRVGNRKCAEVLSKRTIESTTQTKTETKTDTTKAIATNKTNDTAVHTVVRRRKVTRPTPAGPVVTETETIERGKTSISAHTSTTTEDSHGTEVSSSGSQTKTVELFNPPPRWRFGFAGGYQFSPTRPGFVYGAEVDYRILQSLPLMVGGRVYVGPGNITGILALSLNI